MRGAVQGQAVRRDCAPYKVGTLAAVIGAGAGFGYLWRKERAGLWRGRPFAEGVGEVALGDSACSGEDFFQTG